MWQKLKQRTRQWKGVILIALSVASFVIACNILGVFRFLDWTALDLFFLTRSPEVVDARIAIVTVDDKDIEEAGQWPISDRLIAQLIEKIKTQQPRAIGLDIYRDLPVKPGHAELVEVFQSTPNFVGIEKVSGQPVPPPPSLPPRQVGAADLLVDRDGKVRRGLVLADEREGLGAKLALMYLEAEGITLKGIDRDRKIYGLGQALFVPLTGQEGEYAKSETGGYQILLNWRGSLPSFPHVSMRDVLEDRIPSNLMRDRVVLIGTTAPSLKDDFFTPYNSSLLAETPPTPGVAIHANLTSQIISAALDGRPMLRAWKKPYHWLWIVFWAAIGAAGNWLVLQRKWFKDNLVFSGTLFSILLPGFLLICGSYQGFSAGWLIPIFSPGFALTTSVILTTNYHSKWQLKKTNKKLAIANQKLSQYSSTLEDKVQDRTHELSQALNDLKTAQVHLIQSEKMASLGQMVAGVAHEINNPTSFITGNIDYAQEYANDLLELLQRYQETYPNSNSEIQEIQQEVELDYLKEDFPKVLQSIRVGALRIQDIVQSLRVFSRHDESELKNVNIHDGLDSTLMILKNRLQENSRYPAIKICREYGELPLVQCYAGQLNQVFMNLLSNAIDALHERNVELEREELDKNPSFIKIITQVKNDSHIFISIYDNGLGIPLAIQPKLFDPFFTTKPVGKGTGLGLSISHSIVVEKHGGTLQCHSTPDRGTEFQIEIPYQKNPLSQDSGS